MAAAASERINMTLVVCGHAGCGKSTLAGHLLYHLGNLSDAERETMVEHAKYDTGYWRLNYAQYLDSTKEERDHGGTIHTKAKVFYTDGYRYTLVDGPGHRKYIKNMIRGISGADVGLLLVSAEKGGYETAMVKAKPKKGIDHEGSARLHARLLKIFGVEQLIVGVNKMDECNWSQDRFNEIRTGLTKMLKSMGFKPRKIPFIPLSGNFGDNLLEKMSDDDNKALWYKGWSARVNPTVELTGFSLYNALNDLVLPPLRSPDAPLRMVVSETFRIKGVGRIYGARVVQGTARVKDVVAICPGASWGGDMWGKKIFSMQQHTDRELCETATHGDYVGVSLMGVRRDELIDKGHVIYCQEEADREGKQRRVRSFTALVVVLDHPKPHQVGYQPIVFAHATHVACTMTKVLWSKPLLPNSERVEEEPLSVAPREMAEVVFEPSCRLKNLYVEPFDKLPALGRIAVMESNRLKMYGKVTSVTYQ